MMEIISDTDDRRTTVDPSEFDDERLITSATVRKLCGDVSAMTIWRWQKERGFLRPYAVIGQRNFWKLQQIRNWIDEQARHSIESVEARSKEAA